jgi:hypothetical protein
MDGNETHPGEVVGLPSGGMTRGSKRGVWSSSDRPELEFAVLVGRHMGADIVQEGVADNGHHFRWIFLRAYLGAVPMAGLPLR